MGSDTSRTLDELYQLRYDTVLDLYRRRALAYVTEVLPNIGTNESLHPALIFLSNWAGSLAFKLDPYWQFKGGKAAPYEEYKNTLIPELFPVTVKAATRRRIFTCIDQNPIHSYWERTSTSDSSTAKFVNGHWQVTANPTSKTVTSGLQNETSQKQIYGFILDTTDSTRNPQKRAKKESSSRKSSIAQRRTDPPKPSTSMERLNHQGEMELWKCHFETDRATAAIYNDDTYSQTLLAQSGPHGEQLYGTGHNVVLYREGFDTPSASIAKASVDQMPIDEHSNAMSVMTKNCDRMVAQCLPNRRYYNLLYQIGELKDLSQTLRGTLELWLRLEKELGANLFLNLYRNPTSWTKDLQLRVSPMAKLLEIDIRPDQLISASFLNFKFGWESMVQAVKQFADAPARATKDINHLINANGTNVTLRSKFQYSEPMVTTPTISFFKSLRTLTEASKPATSRGIRSVEVRCSVNSGLNLPRVDLPALRKNLFNEKLGATPKPGDLYDLLPWTWLEDWFFGASSYIHLMDEVNGQRNIVNYGLLTYHSDIRVDARWNNYWLDFHKHLIVPPGGQSGENVRQDLPRTATFQAEYQLRKDVMAFAGVADYSGKGLSPYRSSILAALFSQFSGNSSRPINTGHQSAPGQ